MAFEIAQAFVRIRPNTTGFKTETETGIRSTFAGLGKSLALLAGGVGAFDLAKHAIEDAASVQKSMEVISAEFGKGGEAVKQFSETTAVGLGIAPSLAASTAAQFGLLFHNLGIGKGAASEMTINLEKLAGSISEIRGIDPSTVLGQLPRAMLGNLRSLKALGFAFSNTQIQAAAFETEGIKVTATLTPAQKAIAIYSLVTQNLGEYQKQAAAHSGDLVNVQRRLSAEWDKAKTSLGTALLPAITSAATALANFLDQENKSGKLTTDFKSAVQILGDAIKVVATIVGTGWKVFQTAAGWIGGTKRAVEVLLAVLAVNKLRQIASAIGENLVKKGILTIGPAAEKAAGAAGQLQVSYGEASTSIVASLDKVGTAILELASATAKITGSIKTDAAEISTAFAETATSVNTSATRIAAPFETAAATIKTSFSTSFATVRADAATTAADVQASAAGIAAPFDVAAADIRSAFAGAAASANTSLAEISAAAKASAVGVAAPMEVAAGEIGTSFVAARTLVVSNVAMYTTAVKTMPVVTAEAAAATEVSVAAVGFSFEALAVTIKTALISTGIGAIPVVIGIIAVEVIEHFQTIKNWLIEFANWIESFPLFAPLVDIVKIDIRLIVFQFETLKGFFVGLAKFFDTVFTHPIRAIEDAFTSLWDWLKKTAYETVLAIVEPFSHLPGQMGQWARDIKNQLQIQLNNMELAAQVAGLNIGNALGSNMVRAFDVHLETAVKQFSPGGPFASLAGGAIDKAIQGSLNANGPQLDHGKLGTKFPLIQAFETTTTKIKAATAAANAAAAALKAANAAKLAASQQAAAAAAESAKVAAQQAVDAVKAANQKIAEAVGAANDNLTKLGTSLSTMVGKFIDKNTALGVGGLASTTAAFKKLKAQIKSGDTTGIAKAQADLESQLSGAQASQGSVAKRKAAVTEQISNLIDEFKKGTITLKQLNAGVAKELASQGINYKNAGKVLGIAFADGYMQQLKAIREQAEAILLGPKLPKSVVAAASGPKIIRPAQVAADERRKLAERRERARATELRTQASADRKREAAEKAANKAATKAQKTREKQNAVLGSIHGTLKSPTTKKPKGDAGKHATTSSTLGLGYG